MKKCLVGVLGSIAIAASVSTGASAQDRQDFNKYILAAVDQLVTSKPSLGYDLHSFFTEDLKYGTECCVKANHPPKTMCVAAVAETIIMAINAYAKETGDNSVFAKVPIKSWKGGTRKHIRPYIFRYQEVPSTGTGYALEQFALGKQISFDQLRPGDFVNFDRKSGTGHAVVFLGYLDGSGSQQAVYGPNVKGFRYFSAQGSGSPDAGFGYRDGYFEGTCPPAGAIKRDCHILMKLTYGGYMYPPDMWPTYAQGVARIAFFNSKELMQTQYGASSAGELSEADRENVSNLVELLLDQELTEPDYSRYDGVTTD